MLILTVLSACAGPAFNFHAYEGKAVDTADSVLSSAHSMHMIVLGLKRGNSFDTFAESAIQDAEDGASGTISAFETIEPPGRDSIRLRSELDGLLQTASGAISDMRIAFRRGQMSEMLRLDLDLQKTADELKAFSEDHS
ncbi:MAG: hypothetical protein ABR507_06215 [Actinomycetota bacterium]|nr:hypothetical protein [Actinomycetota bacterium]